MRTGTFSEAAVVKKVGETCVSAWLNKRPAMKIPDGLYRGLGWSFRPNNGAATHNLTSIFAQPDGTVLHAVPGAMDASTFLEQMDFALALRGRAADLRAEAHRKAAASCRDRVRSAAHRRMAERPWTIRTFPAALFEDLQKLYSEVEGDGAPAASNGTGGGE